MMAKALPKNKFLLGYSSSYWVIAASLFTAMMLITAPTPIYELWEVRDNFATAGGTVVFSMNALGVLLGLYFAAHLSDQLGRRATMRIALVILMLACGVFIFVPTFEGILVARLLTGLGAGTLTATATTFMTELRLKAHPHANARRGGVIVACVTTGGFALGALMTSILAFSVPEPLVSPFILLLGLLIVAAIAIFFIPETMIPGTPRPRYRPQHLSIPTNARPAFFAATAGAFSSYAILGFFGALTPALVADVVTIGKLHESELGGIVAFSIFIAAALSQLCFSGKSIRTQIMVAAFLTCSGLAALGFSVVIPNLPGLIAGGILAGAGAGLIFVVSVASASALVSAERRGETISAIYFAAYLGMPIPVIGTGLGLITLGPLITVPIFGTLIFALVVWCCRHMLRTHRNELTTQK